MKHPKLTLLVLMAVLLTGVISLVVKLQLDQQAQEESLQKFPSLTEFNWISSKENSVSATNNAGTFSVRAFVSTPQGLLLFYSLKPVTMDDSNPQIEASSSDPSQKITTTLTVLQSTILATVSDYKFGMVQVNQTDKMGQLLNLRVKPAGNCACIWQVTPLKQRFSDQRERYFYFNSFEEEANALSLTFNNHNFFHFGEGGDHNYARLKVTRAEISPTDLAPVYFGVTKQALVFPITQEDFNNSQ